MSTRLVLVHGTRFTASMWDGYAALLPDVEIVAVDLPGHGSRAGEPWGWGAALAAVEVAVAAAPGPVVLAGHSLGGYVAADYARSHPLSVVALVLIGATADASRHPVLTLTYTGFARLLPVVGADRMARFATGVMRRLGAPAQAVPDATGYAVTPQAWADVIVRARAHVVAGLRCPVWLVAGRFDQLRIDLPFYAAAAADPRVRLIAGASHLAPVTHAGAVAAVLQEACAEACAAEATPRASRTRGDPGSDTAAATPSDYVRTPSCRSQGGGGPT